ncbi:MAG: hypothetical protein HETSPECPRED_003391 [Heterodermia speciosa]|uniref:J domain-containing protein n=1 Tax=Heterodermia speciosa TaxID=116794 RepID=A0A8H3I8E3_9LECA|nr:MAG: hypothetical protein HETSPECPRED_003391 [Heterodermia speciosa]
MPSEDLKSYATSDTDFYELLGITFENSQKDLDRAWRKTALKYHPDKVKPNDTEAKEKFHLAQIGYDLLSDPATKALYDNTRTARLQKKRQNELFEGKRRQMKDDLEARERGVKRARTEEEENEEKLERELRRLAEDGKRRRKERENALKNDVRQEAEEVESKVQKSSISDGANQKNGDPKEQGGVSELDRTVKVRWPRDGPGESIGQDQILKLFSTFGKVESAHLLNPKMLRMGKKNKKQLASICMVQYASVVGAHEAVEDFPKQQGPEWAIFDSVNWAANKEPDFINSYQSKGSDAGLAPSTPASSRTSGAAFLNMSSKPSTPAGPTNGENLRKMPSFSSFPSTPKSSPFRSSLGINSPSLEEMTMIRLKNAEKKRLAEEIQRQDEEAAAMEDGNR